MSRPQPFWLPASNYYVLAFAVAVGLFFILWGVLHDTGDELPWVTAGLGASFVLVASVIIRERILRRVSARVVTGYQRKFVNAVPSDSPRTGKLSIEANAAILREIRQKSDAANVLNRFSSGHREVYELCGEYMARNEEELKSVGAASPRLAPLLRGRTTVSELHHYHLLKWAEIEARNLTAEATSQQEPQARIEAAEGALEVIDTALEVYPADRNLLESREAVEGLLTSIKVSRLVSGAERAAFEGRYDDAIAYYSESLFEISRGNLESPEREAASARIQDEIDKLRLASGPLR